MKSLLAALGVVTVAIWSPPGWANLHAADDRSPIRAPIEDLSSLPDDFFLGFETAPSGVYRVDVGGATSDSDENLIIVDCELISGGGSRSDDRPRQRLSDILEDAGCSGAFGAAQTDARSGLRVGSFDRRSIELDVQSLLESGDRFLEFLGIGAEGAVASATPEANRAQLLASADGAVEGESPTAAANPGAIALIGAALAVLGVVGWRLRRTTARPA